MEEKYKLLIYTAVILFFGLLQVWCSTLWYGLKHHEWRLWEFLTQSGLYFFSTSLVASSWWKHVKLHKKISSIEWMGATLGSFSFIILDVIIYTSGLEFNVKEDRFIFNYESMYRILAIVSCVIAIFYSLYSEKRTYENNKQTKLIIE